jgi:hypothetical protein
LALSESALCVEGKCIRAQRVLIVVNNHHGNKKTYILALRTSVGIYKMPPDADFLVPFFVLQFDVEYLVKFPHLVRYRLELPKPEGRYRAVRPLR